MVDRAKTNQIVVHIDTRNRHGFNYLVVAVMRREISPSGRLAEHPLNISGGVYSEDQAFADLEMSGHFNDRGELIGFRPMYYQAHFVEHDRAKAMAAMLAKIQRELVKADAREVGDVYMAFCKAVGASSVAINQTPGRSSTLPECDWRFAPLTEGRDILRRLCVKHGGNPVAA